MIDVESSSTKARICQTPEMTQQPWNSPIPNSRDWIQLIGRNLAHITARKTGLGERPKKRGIPRRIELKTDHHQTRE
jgi:hypothetical protein